MLNLLEGLASRKSENSYEGKVIKCCVIVVVFMGCFEHVVAVWMGWFMRIKMASNIVGVLMRLYSLTGMEESVFRCCMLRKKKHRVGCLWKILVWIMVLLELNWIAYWSVARTIVSIVDSLAGLNSRNCCWLKLAELESRGWCIYRGNAAEISVASITLRFNF